MTSESTVTLESMMAERLGTVDPSAFPSEEFDLYSIPAFDVGRAERLAGSRIGSVKQAVRPNDVLLSRIVPHIRRAWVVGRSSGRRIIASGEWIVFRGSNFEPRYLRHVLVSDPFHAQFMQTVSGVGGSLLRARPAHVAKIRIPLPSLAEQRRIAEILDKADALRTKRRAAIALLDTLTQSIFLDVFGDLPRNPRKWPEAQLGEFAEIVSGITKGRDTRGKATRTVPYLAVVNVQDKKLELSAVKTIDATNEEIDRFRLVHNDLLLTEGGDPDKLGRGTLWQGEIPECIHQNHIFRVRITDNQVLQPLFLNWLIGSEYGKRYFLRSAKQTTGIASINMTQLKAFPLLLPRMQLQAEFATRVADVERIKHLAIRAANSVEELFAALQADAFRGKLAMREMGRSTLEFRTPMSRGMGM